MECSRCVAGSGKPLGHPGRHLRTLSNRRRRRVRTAPVEFVECPRCVAGSGKPLGHGGRHQRTLSVPAPVGFIECPRCTAGSGKPVGHGGRHLSVIPSRTRNLSSVRARRERRRNVSTKTALSNIDNPTHIVCCHVGNMTNCCLHCGARLFGGELTPTSKYGLFHFCCENGAVVLPPFQDVPQNLRAVVYGEQYQKYLLHARQFNHAFGYASFKCHNATLPSVVSDMRIQGAAYTAYGDIRSTSFEDAKFIQVFFTSSDEINSLAKAASLTHLPQSRIVRNILLKIRGVLHDDEISPIWSAYETADRILDGTPTNMRLVFTSSRADRVCGHERTYNLPQRGNRIANDEMGAVIDTADNAGVSGFNKQRDIVIKRVGDGIRFLPEYHPLADPLTYPLLFPRGDKGWGKNCIDLARTTATKKYVSAQQYLNHRIQVRGMEHDYHLHHGRLTQEWILNSHVKIEGDRLDWVRNNQKKLKADLYKEVKLAQEQNRMGKTGQHVVLPSTYKGSPRHMKQLCVDSMAIVGARGKPSFFITMTCNPNWPEIQDNLPDGRSAHHCPWICG